MSKVKKALVILLAGSVVVIATPFIQRKLPQKEKAVPVVLNLQSEDGDFSSTDISAYNINDIWEIGNESVVTTAALREAVSVVAKTEVFSVVTEPEVNFPLDLNKATAEELQHIKGIGPSTAAKIIEYRDENGEYKSVEELLNVSGIGEKKLAEFTPFLFVEE